MSVSKPCSERVSPFLTHRDDHNGPEVSSCAVTRLVFRRITHVRTMLPLLFHSIPFTTSKHMLSHFLPGHDKLFLQGYDTLKVWMFVH